MEPFSFFIIIALLAFRWAWFVRESMNLNPGAGGLRRFGKSLIS
jgi:hypothetical protein